MIQPSSIAPLLEDAGVTGWLVYDYRESNPVFARLVGQRFFLTRRAFLLLTADTPRLLVSRVDATDAIAALDDVEVETYTSWTDLGQWLDRNVRPLRVVAMEYSPNGELPAMSRVDGGTLDLVRALGVDVRSSAELFQAAAAAWSDETLASHHRAMSHVVEIKDLAFEFVAQRLSMGESCSEFAVQSFIRQEFDQRRLITDEPPIVAVNAHSGDPHYEPSADASAEIEPGDWLLIDLWAKERSDEAVFADITWVAQLGDQVPVKRQEVFDVVAKARDSVVAHLRDAHETVRGFELDRVARQVIAQAGYGDYFVHRTGHSLSPGEAVHGLGANLDDLETHDTRSIATGLGFTIEPGIYLPDFGVRSEINVFMGSKGPEVTSPTQEAPLLLDVAGTPTP